ncbi:hypothetical protein MXB_5123, partial [Myxobolus squamalis]
MSCVDYKGSNISSHEYFVPKAENPCTVCQCLDARPAFCSELDCNQIDCYQPLNYAVYCCKTKCASYKTNVIKMLYLIMILFSL